MGSRHFRQAFSVSDSAGSEADRLTEMLGGDAQRGAEELQREIRAIEPHQSP